MAKTDSVMKVFKAVQQWQPSFPMSIDRVAGTWTVTGCVTDEYDFDDILRLRISFSPEDETVLFQFDVGFGNGDEFTQLGEAKASGLCGEGIAENDLPEAWREEFREMVRRWATVALILEPTDECVPVKKQDLFRSSDLGLAGKFALAKEEPDVEVILGTRVCRVHCVRLQPHRKTPPGMTTLRIVLSRRSRASTGPTARVEHFDA